MRHPNRSIPLARLLGVGLVLAGGGAIPRMAASAAQGTIRPLAG